MVKRKIRNINIYDFGDMRTYNRILNLSAQDAGVCFRFEVPSVNDEFILYAKECLKALERAGIGQYTISVVTHNPESKENYLKSATRIVSTGELENLIELETLLSNDAKLVISEKYNGKFYDFSLSEAIQANEFINEEVNYIKSLNLSPFESYLAVYDVVSNLYYSEEKNPDDPREWFKSRLLNSALTQEYFVCVAHAKVICGMLAGLGIKSQMQYLHVNNGTKGHRRDELHNNVLVYLNDLKYGINGIVFSDACNDSFTVKHMQTKRGQELLSQNGRNTMFLSAVNIDDVRNMKDIFTFDEENFLKFLYTKNEKLIGSDFKYIFDGFNDSTFSEYLEFFVSTYPEFKKDFDYNLFLTPKEFSKLTGEDSEFAIEKIVDLFGDIEVASTVEKADLSFDDFTLVIYNSELVKLFMQTIILKFNGIDEKLIDDYLMSQKDDILEGILCFDKDYEVNKVFEHNAYIASKYANPVSEIKPVKTRELFEKYKTAKNDNYLALMLFCFTKRDKFAELFQEIRLNSPALDITDYMRAYLNVLISQGLSEEKAIGYASARVKDSLACASDWFSESSINPFMVEKLRQIQEQREK